MSDKVVTYKMVISPLKLEKMGAWVQTTDYRKLEERHARLAAENAEKDKHIEKLKAYIAEITKHWGPRCACPRPEDDDG
ncbi:MAG: hypothetical protein KAJ19_00465 [Gammaproteobacteria bacterium]|nr:hypothetical protein [Gammaproteobacteria bacterium]